MDDLYGFLAWLYRLSRLDGVSLSADDFLVGLSRCYLPAFPIFRLDRPAHPVAWFHVAPYPRLLLSDSPTQGSQIHVAIQILDVNDNPPQLEQSYEPFACDNAVPGQVK